MNEDTKAYITDLIDNNPIITKLRRGVNTIKNGGDIPMIQPVIIQDPNTIETTGEVQMGIPKKRLMDKLANGINDFQLGFRENYNTGFMPSNLTDQKFSPVIKDTKGFMGRIGEATGTIRRLLDKPVTQGIVGGILNGVLTGSPMYGLIAGSGMASQKANSDVYANALQEQGINVPTGLFNSYDEDDLSALMQPQYKQQEHEIKLLHEQLLNEWRKAQAENRAEKNDIDRDYKENKIINERNKIANGGSGKKDVTQDKQRNEDLATYFELKANPDYADKLNILRAKYVKQYGVDPEQYDKG